MNIRLLRGQAVIREDLEADHQCYTHIIVPKVSNYDLKDAIARRRTWHRGKVLALGPPAQHKGHEVDLGFQVGDDVVFHWEHHERSFTRPWVDGSLAAWVPQHCVDAVVEPTVVRLPLDHSQEVTIGWAT